MTSGYREGRQGSPDNLSGYWIEVANRPFMDYPLPTSPSPVDVWSSREDHSQRVIVIAAFARHTGNQCERLRRAAAHHKGACLTSAALLRKYQDSGVIVFSGKTFSLQDPTFSLSGHSHTESNLALTLPTIKGIGAEAGKSHHAPRGCSFSVPIYGDFSSLPFLNYPSA